MRYIIYLIYITILSSINAQKDFSSESALYENSVVSKSDKDASEMTLWWKRLYYKMSILLQLNYKIPISEGEEVRLCFEVIKYNEKNERIKNYVIFYGDTTSGKFTDIGLPTDKHTNLITPYWYCSRPKNDVYIKKQGLEEENFTVRGANYINGLNGVADI